MFFSPFFWTFPWHQVPLHYLVVSPSSVEQWEISCHIQWCHTCSWGYFLKLLCTHQWRFGLLLLGRWWRWRWCWRWWAQRGGVYEKRNRCECPQFVKIVEISCFLIVFILCVIMYCLFANRCHNAMFQSCDLSFWKQVMSHRSSSEFSHCIFHIVVIVCIKMNNGEKAPRWLLWICVTWCLKITIWLFLLVTCIWLLVLFIQIITFAVLAFNLDAT